MLALTGGSRQRTMYERWITTVRPPVVKFCRQGFDPALMDWTRAQGSKIVGRWVDIELVSSGAENGRIARRVLAEMTPFAAHLDWIEFANEELQGKDDPKQWDILMAACLDFMQQLDAANKAAGRKGPKACIANTSVGQPEIERWSRPSTIEVARYAAANGHAWGHHEYYKPNPWAGLLYKKSTGRPDEKALWDGPAPVVGWLLMRVTQIRDIMRKNGIDGYRFIITESGRDNVPDQPGEGGGFHDAPGEPFADWMVQYGRHLSAILECIGWVDFGYNAWDGWEQFDLTLDEPMHARVLALMPSLPRGASLPTPTPPTPPTPPTTPPSGGNMNAVEQLIWDGMVKAHAARGLPFTPTHALIQEADIPPGVLLPTTDETTVTAGGGRYVAQRFQVSDTGAVVVIYCREGDWGKTYRINGAAPKA